MSFWDGVASFGLGAQGYDSYTDGRADRDYITKKRARDDEVSDMQLEALRRQDELAKTTREIARKYGVGGENQLPERSIEVPYAQPAVDDEGNPMPPPGTKKVTVPAQADTQGLYGALADAHMKAGNLEQAEKIRKALKDVQNEGYGEIVKGVAAGEDPQNIAARFNTRGAKRIVTSDRTDDGTYRFTYEDGTTSSMNARQASDLGTKLGIFKKDMTIIPEGGTAIDGAGNVVARGNPKTHNIDPNSPEGLAARQKLEDYKAKLRSLGAEHATALQKDIAYLVEKGIATDEADAYARLRTSMTGDRASSVSKIMRVIKPATFMGDKGDVTALRQQAEALFDSLNAGGPAAKPKAAPPAASAAPDVQGDIEKAARADAAPPAPAPKKPPQTWNDSKLGALTFTGKTGPNGKPLYVNAQGQQFEADFK